MKIVSESSERQRAVTRRGLVGAALALTLTGCNSTGIDIPGFGAAAPNPQGPTGPTVGETLGGGPVRVGMILPLTQNGAPSPVGASMRNAARLAIDEFAAPYVTLMIEDDSSISDGAATGGAGGARRRRRTASWSRLRE